jgi:hypothetical protein
MSRETERFRHDRNMASPLTGLVLFAVSLRSGRQMLDISSTFLPDMVQVTERLIFRSD